MSARLFLFRERNFKASGTLIIAVWHPAPFWLKISLAGFDFFLPSSLAGWIFRQVKKLSLLAGVRAFWQRGSKFCSARFEDSILPFFNLFCPLDISFLLFITRFTF